MEGVYAVEQAMATGLRTGVWLFGIFFKLRSMDRERPIAKLDGDDYASYNCDCKRARKANTLRILGLSMAGVGPSIAGVRALKTISV